VEKLIILFILSVMTQTWLSNDFDVAAHHIHSITGQQIPSNSSAHYISPRQQLGARWPALKRGQKQPSGWQVVHHRRPQPSLSEEEQRQLDLRKQETAALRAELMADPERRYKYERDQDIRHRVRRLQRDPRFQGWSKRQLWRYVDGYLGRADEPLILRNPKLLKEEGGPKTQSGSRRVAEIERRAAEGNYQIKEYTKEFIDLIKSARCRRMLPTDDGGERPMTQEDLAKLVNVNANVIRDFEAGKLTYDSALKTKLVWKLGLEL